MVKTLLIPESGREDVSVLLALTAEQMRQVSEVLNSRDTLRSSDPIFLQVARRARLDPYKALSVMNAVTNVTRQCRWLELEIDQVLDTLATFAAESEGLEGPRREALSELLAQSDEGYFVEKAERLRNAFVPRLLSVRSICEIRPVFDKERQNIEGALAVVLLALVANDETDEDRRMVVQLDRRDLVRLKQAIDVAEQKLDVIERQLEGALEIFSGGETDS